MAPRSFFSFVSSRDGLASLLFAFGLGSLSVACAAGTPGVSSSEGKGFNSLAIDGNEGSKVLLEEWHGLRPGGASSSGILKRKMNHTLMKSIAERNGIEVRDASQADAFNIFLIALKSKQPNPLGSMRLVGWDSEPLMPTEAFRTALGALESAGSLPEERAREIGMLQLFGLMASYDADHPDDYAALLSVPEEMRVLGRITAARHIHALVQPGDDTASCSRCAYLYASLVNDTRPWGQGDPRGARFSERELRKIVAGDTGTEAGGWHMEALVMAQRVLRYAEKRAKY